LIAKKETKKLQKGLCPFLKTPDRKNREDLPQGQTLRTVCDQNGKILFCMDLLF